MAEETLEINPYRSRAGHLGVLSKLYNEVELLLRIPFNNHEVEEYLIKIKSQFERYDKVHSDCFELLNLDESNQVKMASLSENHDKHLAKYQEMCRSLTLYLESYHKSTPKEKVRSHRNRSVKSSTSTRASQLKEKQQKAQLRMQQLQEAHAIDQQQEQIEQQFKTLQRQKEITAAQHQLQEIALETEFENLEELDDCISTGYGSVHDSHQPVDHSDHTPVVTIHDHTSDNVMNTSRTNVPTSSSVFNGQPNTTTMVITSNGSGANVTTVQAGGIMSSINPTVSAFIPNRQQLYNTERYFNSTGYVPPVSSAASYVPFNSEATGYMPQFQNFTSSTAMSKLNPSAGNFIPGSYNQTKTSASFNNQLPQLSNYVLPTQGYDKHLKCTEATSQSQVDNLAQLVTELALPKPELLLFDGDAKNYQSFITNFMTHVGNKVKDPCVKLTYLMQYCTEKVKRLIKNCVLMPPHQGYNTALDLLRKHFGQNHVVARSYIDSLTKGTPIKPNDVDALVKFTQEVIDCHMVLENLNFTSDMDSQETIGLIIDRLPNHLQVKWIEKAADINQHGREPHFADVRTFIEHKSMVADSMYGRRYANASKVKFTSLKHSTHSIKPKVSTMTTQVNVDKCSGDSDLQSNTLQRKPHANEERGYQSKASKSLCVYCKLPNHLINKCYKFVGLSYSDRFEFVKSNKLCFRCLKLGHKSSDCKGDIKCSKCGRRHSVLLHDDSREENASEIQENIKVKPIAETPAEKQKTVLTSTSSVTQSKVYLGIIPVVIVGNDIQVQTYALLDSGSNTSLLKRELYDTLKLQGTPTSYCVQTINGNKAVDQQYKTSVLISDPGNCEQVQVQALTVDNISVSLNSLPSETDIKKWKHFQDINIPNIDASQVGILIGSDCPSMFWSLEERRGECYEPYARLTLLGWTIIGPANENLKQDEHQVNLLKVDVLQEQLNRQWNIDFQDLSSDPITEMSIEDKRTLKIIEETVQMIQGKYHVSIPWKIDPDTLPNNKQAAEQRLKFLKHKLHDPKLHEQYKSTMEKYIQDGHARKIAKCELIDDKPAWYLPHHPVFKKSNPSKCRIVFDCAAQYKGISLNDAIYQGPNLLNSLAGVLMRFRQENIAVVADIEAMFHQCYITPHDQNFLRFLWWPDGNLNQEPEVYAMLVHLFGATSSPCIANYCLRKNAKDNKSNFSNEAIEAVNRSFYMDDLLKSTTSTEKAYKLIVELKSLLKKGGFNLTKWISSHRDVIAMIPEEDRAKSLANLSISDTNLPQEQTLGLKWNVEEDCFIFDVEVKDKPLTRRGLLSMTASLFDPLGFVCPVTLIPKLIQHDLCRSQLGWDDSIPIKEAEVFTKWQMNVPKLSAVKIPRSFKKGLMENPSKIELHVFSDASEFAYGAVAYLKLYNAQESTVKFIMGKSRVAPLKSITIPRLELTAATVAAKLCKFIVREIDIQIENVFLWTDSMTVLRYLENTATRFQRFVANRIQVIQELTNVKDWNYVTSSENPADFASRGIKPTESKKLTAWLQGPVFLQENRDYKEIFSKQRQDTVIDELEVKQVFTIEAVQNINHYIKSFSSYHKLITAISWLNKFIMYLKFKLQKRDLTNFSKMLKVTDIEEAELQVIRLIQAEVYEQELKHLESQQKVHKASPISKLCPILEQNIIKVGGRLKDSQTEINKHPVILPRHFVTDLYIRQVHEMNGHIGTNHTLSIVRRKFFIIPGYSMVKKIINSCFTCKRISGQTCEQKMADLPKERTAVQDSPFTVVGIDYFGPLFVKHGRGSAKRYGCLISCLVTRAVHIEIAHTLDSNSFLMALHRFIARRGKPTKIYSDNGRNFVGAEKELCDAIQELNKKKVQDTLLMEAIEWYFNPPHASHMGGIWERLVRSVKTIMKSLIKQDLLTDEELRTFMCEVEKIMNDRPLTTVSSDARDQLPLTPNHLLLLKENSSTPTTVINYVKRRWQVIHQIANKFYSRFVDEYLPLLQTRQKWQNVRDNIKVNDIVLVMDENLPRGQWPLGLVTRVIYGRDELVRSVHLKVGNSTKVRPITKLVLLEHQD